MISPQQVFQPHENGSETSRMFNTKGKNGLSPKLSSNEIHAQRIAGTGELQRRKSMKISKLIASALVGMGLVASAPASAQQVSGLQLQAAYGVPAGQVSINGSGLVQKTGFHSQRGFRSHVGFKANRGFKHNRGFKSRAVNRGFKGRKGVRNGLHRDAFIQRGRHRGVYFRNGR
jgi:hypothetical protein